MLKKYKNSIFLLFTILLIKLSSSNIIIERLTGDTQPINYNIVLDIKDLKSDAFSGIVTIQLKCVQPTNIIKLHSENLIVTSVKLNGIKQNSFNVDGGFLTINLATNLVQNTESTLVIRYSGLINDNLTGLYRTYYSIDGEERVVASTFLVPNLARKVLPCYDEPQYKSTFEVVIQHPVEYKVLGNTQIHSEIETLQDASIIRTEFAKTPKMSSYLLAFAITDFVPVVSDQSVVSVYVPTSKTNLVNLALDFGGTSLAKFEEYLDQKYQIAKMDFILFDDFFFGAMESWGLITYRSSKLYYDSNTSSINQYYMVLKIVAHELAHQWFGNQVTSSWWSHIWLNEGFSTFMEDYIMELIYPEMRNMDIFLVDTVQEAMQQDISIDIKPMNNAVGNTDQLSTIYDFIAYKKSGAVIRMIETFVTPNNFQQIVRNYIKLNSYAAVSPLELYRSFEKILHDKTDLLHSVNITEFISCWADNPGYPILNVLNHFNNGTFEISQHRFLADGSVRESNFIIPTTYVSNGTNTTQSLIIQSSFSLEIVTENNENDWVLFNVDSNGYYRVNYDLRNWYVLISELSNTGKTGYVEKIRPINRAQLIDDAFNLAKYSYLTYNVSIDLIGYIKREVDLIPIKAALKNLDFLVKMYRGIDNIEPIKEFVHDVIRPLFRKFSTVQSNNSILRLTRMEVFNFACKVGLTQCVEYVESQISAFVKKNIDADIRQGYFYGLARANPSYFVEYMATLLATKQMRDDNFEEINEVIAALACIADEMVPTVISLLGDSNIFELTVPERQRILEALLSGDDDNIEVVASTFLVPNLARKVLPCYDEPQYKSTFEVVIQHPVEYKVLGNTQIHSEIETLQDASIIRTEFAKTPKMSSYLLAFAITDFVPVVSDQSVVSVYVPTSKTNLVNLALDFGGTSLAKFEEYLDQKYQIAKMDFILFDDFFFGAMESWGLITYRSSKLYYDSNTSSINQYYMVLKIVAHELAHQWFGNQVTSSWWSHIWLNEGFSTFMEDYIMELIYPEMRNMDIFLVDTVQEAMQQDISIDIKPMNNAVGNTDQLSTIYDFIAYKKSGAVIRMIETFVTPNNFQQIVRNYIKLNSYAAVSPLELYRSFEKILHDKTDLLHSVNITEFISCWADNPGYPILNVLNHFNNGTFEISQHRFLADGSVRESNFIIPTTYVSNGTNTTQSLIIQSSFSLEIVTENNENDWVLFNVDSNGYYRVNYDLRNWYVLISELSNTGKTGYVEKIRPINRAQLIDDAFNLAKYSYLTYNVSIDLIGYIKREVDLIPIKAALKNLDFLVKMYRGIDNIEPIKEFVHDVIRPLFRKFSTVQSNNSILRLTRMEVFNFACKVGLKQCVEYVESQISAFVKKNIDADIRQGYFYGLARANPSYFVEYMATLLATKQMRDDNFEEINEVIAALACIADEMVPTVISLLGDSNIFELTVPERQRILEALLSGDDDNIEQVLYYIRDNYAKLAEFDKPQLFTRISYNIISAKSKTIFDDVINKLMTQLSQADRDVLMTSQKSIEANVNWVDTNIPSIIDRIRYKPVVDDDTDDEEVDDATQPIAVEPMEDDFPFHYVIIGVLVLLVIIALAFVLRKRCCK